MLKEKVVAHIWFWQVKIFCEPYRLIWIQKSRKTDPRIRKSGFLDPDPSVGAPKKILLAKTSYGLPLLLVHFFDLALPSRGYILISPNLTEFY